MKRVFIILLDSLGIGYSKDAYKFGDKGSNTLGHIAEVCNKNIGNINRKGNLYIPNLTSLGLGLATKHASGKFPVGLDKNKKIIASYGYASSISSGKDTCSGHWEISGVPVLFDWHYFKKRENTFPNKILKKILLKTNIFGYLGNCHDSGTNIIYKLGEEHIKTKKPIIYTSSDSVFQIACHEKIFSVEKLYKISNIIRKILNKSKYKINRVIARPFLGTNRNNFYRTNNRLDITVKPHGDTVMYKLIKEINGKVVAIGKVSDIYSNIGITKSVKSFGIKNLFLQTLKYIKKSSNNSIVFTNFVDFDSLWGHRRDVYGYAKGLELFDSMIPKMIKILKSKDLLIFLSDHGCDPTWYGTNHTREYIPILLYSRNIKPCFIGHRKTFSDIAQTISSYFGLSKMDYGKSII
ncbi:phosphopentomutase [Buchnera aphidicola (Taiwanaphis decaspermi)]|uniref:phosphopentomutase n=1 Tax=Buchnera aphidicola TaxID=9 RepID=UPI0031B84EB6